MTQAPNLEILSLKIGRTIYYVIIYYTDKRQLFNNIILQSSIARGGGSRPAGDTAVVRRAGAAHVQREDDAPREAPLRHHQPRPVRAVRDV